MTTCCTDTRKLVRWNIVFLKPGYEVAFPEQEELISGCMSESEFQNCKVAEFARRLPPRDELPREWQSKGYPPQRNGKIELPSEDCRYIRVYSQVLRCYEKQPWDFEETQIAVLEQIRNAIRGEHHHHRVRLPKTRRLAGALNTEKSEFGDEFINMPPFLGAHPEPGHTFLSGWVEVIFSEPKGNIADFALNWYGVGTPVVIKFGGGQEFEFFRTKTFPLPFLPNLKPVQTKGQLDLVTGKVLKEKTEIYATFQGTTIARTDRVNRIPYAFPYIYPPLTDLEVQPPPDYRPPMPPPRMFGEIEFSLDFEGNITGFELHSETFAPVGLFPYIKNFFPPYTFGPNNEFHFANPDRCQPGTPPQNCPNQQDNPDGILTSVNVYFHPHIDLVSEEMSEITPQATEPACAPEPTADAVVVEAGGRLYQIGGTDKNGITGRVNVYDPIKNQWSSGPALPYPTASAQGAVVGRRIYVLGGWTDPNQPPTARVHVLDIDSGQWEEKEPLKVPVAAGTATAVDKKIFVISGSRSSANGEPDIVPDVQILDTRNHTWSQGTEAAMPAVGASAVAVDDEILVIGGRTAGNDVSRRTGVYSPKTNLWSLGPDTINPVYQAAAGRIEGRIFLVGGRSKVEGQTLMGSQELDLARDKWREGLPQPLSVAAAGGAVLGEAFYVIGGRATSEDGPGTLTQAVQVLQPARGWLSCAQLPLFTAAGVISLGAEPRPQSPGALALLVGSNLAGPPDSVTITVGNQPAPIVAALPQAVFFQIPTQLSTKTGRAELRLTRSDSQQQAPPIEIPVAPIVPGLFVYDYAEPVEPAFLRHNGVMATNDVDGTLNFASQPARPGELVSLWATGLGKDPLSPDLPNDLKAIVGGKEAKVEKITPMPVPPPPLPQVQIPGVYLVQVRIPNDAQRASYSPVVLRYKNMESNPVGLSIRDEDWRKDPKVMWPEGLPAVFPFLAPPPPQ